jgi:glutathione peroxidase
MKKLMRISLVIIVILGVFAIYVETVNQNSKKMSYRQKVLKAIYPALMWWTKITKNRISLASTKAAPFPFYALNAVLNNGDTLMFESLRGKKVMLVNTASDCGYTDQYDDLEKLYKQYSGKLIVIGFPANDFKEQEKGTDEEIAQFCKLNYGVTFPLIKKSVVIQAPGQNDVYKWLTDPARNGWNDKAPTWNFSKYLVDEKGRLINYFGPSVPPMSDAVIKAINE